MFFAQILVVLVALAVAFAAKEEYPNVSLELYYEALCPGCQQFITGPLTNVMALPDIVAILDLKLVPYGNTKKAEDGTFSCQHGPDECTSDVYEQCTMYKLNGNLTSISSGATAKQAWPFVQCMEIHEGAPSAAESCFADTMKTSGLSWSTVTRCAAEEADLVQSEAAAATPKHDYVPWVLLNGAVVENTNALLPQICKAYTGPAPPSCKRLYFNNDEKCMNK